MCKCKGCGEPMEECEFTVCINCFLEMSDDEVTKNLVSGGEFHGPKWEAKMERIISREE